MLDLITPTTVQPNLQELKYWIELSIPSLTEAQVDRFIELVDTCVRAYPEYTLYKCVEFAVRRNPDFGQLIDDDHRIYTQAYCIKRRDRHQHWAKLINDHFGRELPGMDAWFLGYVANYLWVTGNLLWKDIICLIQFIYVDVDRNGKTFVASMYDNAGSVIDSCCALWLLAVIIDFDRCILTNLSAAAMD